MPEVRMHVTGKAAGASDEPDGFAEMVRTVVRAAAGGEPAHVHVRVGADDAAAIEVAVERSRQQAIGEALERLLAEPEITSEVVGEGPQED
jgi:uncharacterized protein (DUF849 family)